MAQNAAPSPGKVKIRPSTRGAFASNTVTPRPSSAWGRGRRPSMATAAQRKNHRVQHSRGRAARSRLRHKQHGKQHARKAICRRKPAHGGRKARGRHWHGHRRILWRIAAFGAGLQRAAAGRALGCIHRGKPNGCTPHGQRLPTGRAGPMPAHAPRIHTAQKAQQRAQPAKAGNGQVKGGFPPAPPKAAARRALPPRTAAKRAAQCAGHARWARPQAGLCFSCRGCPGGRRGGVSFMAMSPFWCGPACCGPQRSFFAAAPRVHASPAARQNFRRARCVLFLQPIIP